MDRLTPQQWQEANQIKAEREKNKKHGQKDEPAAQSSAPSPSVEANGEKKPIADQPGSSTPAQQAAATPENSAHNSSSTTQGTLVQADGTEINDSKSHR
jgi:hypothetical protein